MDTSAKLLGRLWKELLEEGVPAELAEQILLIAAREHGATQGFAVTPLEVSA
jgi:hypothetical protein